jgi:hypothetical protein
MADEESEAQNSRKSECRIPGHQEIGKREDQNLCPGYPDILITVFRIYEMRGAR